MKKTALFCTVLIACTDDAGTFHALDNQGFTDIQITGYEWLGCGKDDLSSTGFRAKNPAGKPVSGVVCCGVTKNCTVRW